MEITFKAFAYRADWHNMADIEIGKEMPYIWKFEGADYQKIGTAKVIVTLFAKEERHSTELHLLNETLEKVRAENQQRENEIIDRISKLSAIGYEVAE
jgi:hypothetical protein